MSANTENTMTTDNIEQEFVDLKNIKTRDELLVISNYWIYKLKYLEFYNNNNTKTESNIKKVKIFINQLKLRDNELLDELRAIAVKERVDRKKLQQIEKKLQLEKDKRDYKSLMDNPMKYDVCEHRNVWVTDDCGFDGFEHDYKYKCKDCGKAFYGGAWLWYKFAEKHWKFNKLSPIMMENMYVG
jgi:hypothetical protein